ncbi:YihY/virulence factor BrkB family protein [Knoellia sp. Soil729]|uniref:YihY/virulence factor BrkB family protein n=1 Tax=Knoellia sp. Soil729 TaxID=1736394 RepID=UPI0006FC1AA8|nr:YihY/virulence factor BrkB family protein [Knoellia sp. Soil729]KRE43987.1 ribonuclease BN [Knoellia sp. Soil729]
MAQLGPLDRFQREHRVLGYPLAVLYKFFDDQAGYLVGLIAYYAFLSFFPLLLIFSTGLSLVLSNYPNLQQRVLDSALQEIPVIGAQLGDPQTLRGSITGVVVSSVVALYGGLGVGQAFQYAMNTVWGVPRNSRPNPFRARGRSLLLLLTILLFVVLTTTVTIVSARAISTFPLVTRVAVTVATFLGTALVFALGMRRAVAIDLKLRQVAVGAVGAAMTWQLLQYFGVQLVERVVNTTSATNGVFGIVIGLFAFFHLAAFGTVFFAEADVVRANRLYPRSLLTPFTDDVELTDGDRKAYAQQARIGRFKQYQQIDVAFERSGADPDGGDTFPR